METDAMSPRRRRTQTPLSIIFTFAAFLWLVEVANALFGHPLLGLGIFPRSVGGLIGIPLSPFIHAGFVHLALNTGPLLVLGGLILTQGRSVFYTASLIILLVGGLGVWLIGRPSIHVGASGLIFGYFGFLVARGVYRKRLGAGLISALVVAAYGGMVWGMLPTAPGVSWEGHVCGFAAGILAARAEKR